MTDTLQTFPASRPVGYDADKVWTPDAWSGDSYTDSKWSDADGIFTSAGGGRHQTQLLCVCTDRIYYEAI